MGILCRFSNYDENYDILGAVFLFKYIESREGVVPKRTIRSLKQKSLTELEREDFVGVSFDVLIRVMGFQDIPFELYCNEELIVKNEENARCKLVSSSAEKCEKLLLAQSEFDIYSIPESCKKPGAPKDKISSYITRLDEVIYNYKN